MSRWLLLLRHAEAQAADAAAADFDRTLTERGRAQAHQAAQRMAAAGLHPDLLLASPSARTRETAEIVALELGGIGRTLAPEALYLASAPVLLSLLQACDDAAGTLLLVGHNPGLSALARELAAGALHGSSAAARGAAHGAAHGAADAAALELGLAAMCRLTVQTPSWRTLGAAVVRAVTLG